MNTFIKVVGILLLVPIALVIVALTMITLIGGYIGLLIKFTWEVILFVGAIILVIMLIRHFVLKK